MAQTSAGDRERAEAAFAAVHRDLARARTEATALLRSRDPQARAVALWTLGKVHYEQGRVPDARTDMRRAVALARRHGLRAVEGGASVSLAAVLVEAGQARAALETLDRAAPLVQGVDVGRAGQQRAFVLFQLGRWSDAVLAASRALPSIRAHGDRVGESRLLLVRGVSHLCAGAHHDAVSDLRAAHEVASAIGERLVAALAEQDLGCAWGRIGDIPVALAAFDRARAAYAAAGGAARLVAILDVDLAETLLLAGLTDEACEAGERAAAAAAAAGNVVNEGDARLMLARAHLAAGRCAEAGAAAGVAAALFRRARRSGWTQLARYVSIQAEVADADDGGRPRPALLRDAVTVAERLDQHGWPREAAHVRTLVARVALALDRPDVAASQLAAVAVATRRGDLASRTQAYQALALAQVAAGDRVAARRTIDRGLRLVEQHRAAVGSSELRSGVALHGVELARLGLRLALDQGRPADVLRAAERWRSGALRMTPVRPPADTELARLLSRLRGLRLAEARGGPSPGATDGSAGSDAARERQAELARVERAVSARARRVAGGAAGVAPLPSLRSLRDALGAAVLLAFVELEGDLRLVRVDGAGCELFELGPVAAHVSERQHLASAARRVLAHRAPTDLARNAAAHLASASARLDALLVPPGAVPPGSPVVVVPSASLQGLPWRLLPSLGDSDIVVAPNVAVWHDRAVRPWAAVRRAVLVAGPDVPGAAAEIDALARLYPSAVVRTGTAATVPGVVGALDAQAGGALHLAAHGTFRRDNPLFSSFRLADGPLTVYDLERVGAAPELVVLASCSAGTVSVRPGDELAGAASALLHLGARTLVAPVDVVDDALTAPFVVDLHRRLVAGERPAGALARAQRAARDDGMRAWVNAALFTCAGA